MGVSHDRGYHPLRVKRVTVETAEARSYTLDVPGHLAAAFRYEAGQFVTFRVPVGDRVCYRSYSMSSAPAVDDELTVVVKRVPGGVVSNWINDSLHEGDTIDSSVPAGVFRLGAEERDLVAFAAGSGITPIYSILKTALATTGRSAQLLYANRDVDSIIFDSGLDELATTYPGRLLTTHHLDSDRGFVTAADLEPYIDAALTAEVFICGPAAFMDLVEATLLARGVPPHRVHIERFSVTPADEAAQAAPQPDADRAAPAQITIELDGKTGTTTHHPGATILQTARQMGMTPPFSCEAGNCATCMAKLVEGEVTMYVNDALFDDEVAAGWILTCQSVPTTPTVHVVYGYED